MEELIMSDVVAVTNRHLCVRDYFEQIEVVASSGVNKIIVREKDLAPQEYKELFVRVRDICSVHKVKAIPHYFWRRQHNAVLVPYICRWMCWENVMINRNSGNAGLTR